MYVWMHVCLYVYVYVCIHVRMHVCVAMYGYVCMYLGINIYLQGSRFNSIHAFDINHLKLFLLFKIDFNKVTIDFNESWKNFFP